MFFSRVRVNPDIRELSHLHHLLRGNGYGAHQLFCNLFPDEKERNYLFREEIAGEQIPHCKGARGEPIFYLVSQTAPTKGNPLFMIKSKPYAPKLKVGEHLSFKLRANPTISRKEAGKKNSIRHDVVMDAQHHLLRELAKEAGAEVTGKKKEIRDRVLATLLESNKPAIGVRLSQILEQNERYRETLAKRLSPQEHLNLALKAAADSALETWLCERGKKHGFAIAKDKKGEFLKFQAEGYRWHALPQKGRSAGFSSIDFEGEIEVLDPTLFVESLFSGIGPAKAFGCGLMLVRRETLTE